DGQRVLTGSDDKTAVIWDAQTGRKVITFQGHTATVTSLAWSPDGQRVLTGSRDGSTRIWAAGSGKALATVYSFNAGKDRLVITPQGYVNGSPGGLEQVAWRKPGTPDFGPTEELLKRFHQPDMVARLIQATMRR
ncbi:MAG: hypothetical protein NZ700_10050, partial [Gemmataceae bacterium]|nr:hypothetical protein [Gemmataceae bacterium]MDW8264410.1 hypothetical protein [Gemmataceae bacterium]